MSYAVGNDTARPQTAGIRFVTTDGTTRATATDGHRLADAYADIGEMGPFDVLIYPAALSAILQAIDGAESFEWATDDRHVYVRTPGGVELSGKRVVDQNDKLVVAVPADHVIPKRPAHSINVERSVLLGAFRRMGLMTRDKTCGVSLTISGGEMRIASDNPDKGEAAEVVPCDCNGADLRAGVNARFVIEALGILDADSIVMGMDDNDPKEKCVLSPIKWGSKGAADSHVVMPMRL